MTPPDHLGDDGTPHAGDGAPALSAARLRGVLDGTYARVFQLPASNGTDDTAALQSVIAQAGAAPGSVVRGLPGATYLLSSALNADKGMLYLYPGVTYDFTGCTIKAKDAAIGYPVQMIGQQYAVLAPPNLAATPSASGGTLTGATYSYAVSAVTAAGETMVCPWVTATTTGSTGSVALTWSAPNVVAGGPAVTGYRIYGRLASAVALVGTTTAGTVTFTDTGAGTTAASLPTGNATITRASGRVTIIGGTWDANQTNRTCDFNWPTSGKYAGHFFDLQKLTDLDIRDVTVNNARKWAIAVADWTGTVRATNLTFNTQADGIHVVGPGGSFVCRGVRGTVGDDMVAFSLAEWPTYAVSAGSIERIEVSDLYGTAVPSFFRGLGAAGWTLGSLRISDVSGTYLGAGSFLAAIYVADEQPSPGHPNGTDINQVVIERVNIRTSDNGTMQPIAVRGRNLGVVNINDITVTDTNVIRAVYVKSLNTTQTIDLLRLANIKRVGSSTSTDAVLIDATTIRRAVIDGLHYTNPGSTGSGGYALFVVASTIADLEIAGLYHNGASGSGNAIRFDGALAIDRIAVRNSVLAAGFRLCDVTWASGALIRELDITNCRLGSGSGEFARIGSNGNQAIDVTLLNNRADVMSSAGMVTIQTGQNVTIRGGGNILPASKTVLAISGTPTVRVNGADLPVDLGTTGMAPIAGDQARNTNTSWSSGTGTDKSGVYGYTGSAWTKVFGPA